MINAIMLSLSVSQSVSLFVCLFGCPFIYPFICPIDNKMESFDFWLFDYCIQIRQKGTRPIRPTMRPHDDELIV